jgi:hypothetical protein
VVRAAQREIRDCIRSAGAIGRRPASKGQTLRRAASYKKQKRNEGVTEITEIPNRGHALTIDSRWREVCHKALAFVKRFV